MRLASTSRSGKPLAGCARCSRGTPRRSRTPWPGGRFRGERPVRRGCARPWSDQGLPATRAGPRGRRGRRIDVRRARAAVGSRAMANPHFGEIGDVWKHLVLGDLLDRSRPARYWETHAGSGTYTLDRSWEREYGVFTLLREASRAPAIEASRYLWLLRTLPPGDDGEPRYPGSARLAMEVLGDSATYVLCDLDTAQRRGPDTVGARARSHRLRSRRTRRRARDDLGELAGDARGGRRTPRSSLIDPFDPTQRSADGMDALDLFAALAAAGFRTMLWLADDDAADRARRARHRRRQRPGAVTRHRDGTRSRGRRP